MTTVAPPRSPAREYLRFLKGGVALLTLYGVASFAGIEPAHLATREGLSSALELLEGFTRPDLSAAFLSRVLRLTGESFAIGFMGLALALVIGIPLALVSVRLPILANGPRPRSTGAWLLGLVRPLARSLLSVFRSIPEIIWAFLFVRIVGLGPGPAVLAIGITFGGIIGKLFSELMESIPPQAGRRLRAAGSSPLGIAFYGVLPQVRHRWVGYGLFRLECAIRSASVLGVVGAGGIGAEIDLSIRYFEYDKLATTLLAVILCVSVLEILSAFLRRRHVGWSMLLLGGGAIFGACSLSVRWGQLVSAHALEQCITFAMAFTDPQGDIGWLGEAASEVGETLCMAAVATTSASALAFVLAPFVSARFSSRGGLMGESDHKWRVLDGGWGVVSVVVRGGFQIARALPELVWALLFVMWVGPGPTAGTLAIAAHTVGVLGRLFSEVYEDIDPRLPRALESRGGSRVVVWGYGVMPQALRSLQAFTLFRFEVNIRSTVMMGFVGAGGIGNSIHTAISLFHYRELASLLLMLFVTVVLVDAGSSAIRRRIMES